MYSAQTVIQIEGEEQKVVKIEGVQSEDLKSLEALKTFEQNVTSPEVLLRVIHNPELRNDPTFLPEVEHKSDNALQKALAGHIDAKLRRGTRLIDITVNHRSPVMAQKDCGAACPGVCQVELSRLNVTLQKQHGVSYWTKQRGYAGS